MKKIFILFFALITSAVSMFASVEINGIAYNLNTTNLTAEVTKKTEKYSGDVIIPESFTADGKAFLVTKIGVDAFANCENLTSITIPSNVESLGNYPFTYCIALTAINVNEDNPFFSSVDGVLFNYSKSILYAYPPAKQGASYTIPSSVTSIQSSAFSTCTNLSTITIPNKVKSIGTSAFVYCRGLTSITIPSSVTSIGNNAFRGCISLASIDVVAANSNYCSVDGVLYNKNKTSLINYPAGKQGIEYIIPNSVTSIGSQSFTNSKLTSIHIPQVVKTIGDQAFWECTNLTSINIPNSVINIGNFAFDYCSGLTSITCEAVTPPSMGSDMFYMVDKSIPLYVPEESIEAYKAADQWKSLTNIQAIKQAEPCNMASGICGAEGDNLTWELSCDSILIISGSGKMKDFQKSDSVPWIDYSYIIKSISLPNGITSIGNYAFITCNNFTSITIPESVTSIGKYAFAGCLGLDSITIPNSVTSIGDVVFYTCINLKHVALPNSVNYLSMGMFQDCRSLKSINIPNNITIFSQYAFSGCTSLTSFTIPSGVKSLTGDDFSQCTALTSIYVEETNPKYCSVEGVLFNKDKTSILKYPAGKQDKEYNIPEGDTVIGLYAFEHCSNLTSITIPNSVKSISLRAFSDCKGLTSVTIPNSVTNIGYEAFQRCTGLTSFTCEAIIPPLLGNKAFNNVDKSIPVYVPAESIEAYRNADQWKDFTNIQAIAGFDPEHPANPGSYQLTLVVEDTNKGYTTGSGLYEQGSTAHIEAIARDGYQFVCWSDNDSNAVRDIVIIRDSTLTASFTEALGDDTVYVDFTRDLDDLPIGKNTNVIITPYGRLNITRPIAIKSLMIEKDTAFGQVSGVDMLQAESVEVMHYFYRHIDEGSYRWFAFSVPFTVSVAEGIFMNEAHDVARYGVDFVIDEYDGHLRATTQEGWKRVAANATLYPGKFYMIASKQANIWYFKALDPSTAFDAEPFAPITAYSSAIGDHHAGWNGIANTLFVNANLQAKNIQYATTYNNYYGVYSVMPLTNYMTERPGMPFFVQASEHDTIEFRAQPEPLYTDGGIGDPIPADAPSRLRRAHESRPFVLSIGNSEYTDKAYVDLAADKEDRYTIGEDLIKMQTSKPTVPQIWINAYDAHLAAYAMPAKSEKSAIELGISTPQEGTYTLSFNNVPQGMTMFISKDGEHLYPLSNGEYEIYLEKGVNTNYRIDIYRTPAIYTDIENINSSKGHCEKMIKDGKLYLLYEGTMYNVQGVKVIDK